MPTNPTRDQFLKDEISERVTMIAELYNLGRLEVINIAMRVLSDTLLCVGENNVEFPFDWLAFRKDLDAISTIFSSGSAFAMESFVFIRNRVNAEIDRAISLGSSYNGAVSVATANIYLSAVSDNEPHTTKHISNLYAVLTLVNDFTGVPDGQPKTVYNVVTAVVTYIAELIRR